VVDLVLVMVLPRSLVEEKEELTSALGSRNVSILSKRMSTSTC
jgi:hypothetical protein